MLLLTDSLCAGCERVDVVELVELLGCSAASTVAQYKSLHKLIEDGFFFALCNHVASFCTTLSGLAMLNQFHSNALCIILIEQCSNTAQRWMLLHSCDQSKAKQANRMAGISMTNQSKETWRSLKVKDQGVGCLKSSQEAAPLMTASY